MCICVFSSYRFNLYILNRKRNISWILGISMFISQMHEYTSGIILHTWFPHSSQKYIIIASQASVGALRVNTLCVPHER